MFFGNFYIFLTTIRVCSIVSWPNIHRWVEIEGPKIIGPKIKHTHTNIHIHEENLSNRKIGGEIWLPCLWDFSLRFSSYVILFTCSVVEGKSRRRKRKRAENDQWTEASVGKGPLTIFAPFYFRPFLFSTVFIFGPLTLGPFLFGPMIFGPSYPIRFNCVHCLWSIVSSSNFHRLCI